MNYSAWLEKKGHYQTFSSAPNVVLGPHLFDYQRDLVQWALTRGRAALFADTGLGKTPMLLDWSKNVASEGRVLIVAPLAVGNQIAQDGEKFGVPAVYRRADEGDRITVTNYEMSHHFNMADFSGVVLDESSILKSHTGKFRARLIETCASVPWRLACTATPAPNDFTELGNHSEWLGVKTRSEMLSEFFVHDGGSTQDWRVKGHAVDPFWRWVCRWGAMVKRPSDLGYDDTAHTLPELHRYTERLELDHTEAFKAGSLFIQTAHGLNEQRKLRRATTKRRAEIAADVANRHAGDSVLIWCEYNDEANLVASLIPDAVQVAGSDTVDAKTDRMLGFADGRYRVLVSKPKICGFGMNFQRCNRQVFLGPSNSYEQTYQAIRRSWRFGQTRHVHIHTVCSNAEMAIVANLQRKHQDAGRMSERTLAAFREVMREFISAAAKQWDDYSANTPIRLPEWVIEGGYQ